MVWRLKVLRHTFSVSFRISLYIFLFLALVLKCFSFKIYVKIFDTLFCTTLQFWAEGWSFTAVAEDLRLWWPQVKMRPTVQHCNINTYHTAYKYETAPYFCYQTKSRSKLYMFLFVDFCVLPRFCSEHQNRTFFVSNQVYSGKNRVKHKSTNNRLTSFGLIEKNMGLSHIYLAVKKILVIFW